MLTNVFGVRKRNISIRHDPRALAASRTINYLDEKTTTTKNRADVDTKHSSENYRSFQGYFSCVTQEGSPEVKRQPNGRPMQNANQWHDTQPNFKAKQSDRRQKLTASKPAGGRGEVCISYF